MAQDSVNVTVVFTDQVETGASGLMDPVEYEATWVRGFLEDVRDIQVQGVTVIRAHRYP